MPYLSTAASGGFDKCQLTTYSPNNCPDGTTPHHLIADSMLHYPNRRSGFLNNVTGPSHAQGLCICLEGTDKNAAMSDEALEELGLDASQLGAQSVKTGERSVTQAVLESTRVPPAGRLAQFFSGWGGASPFEMALAEHGQFHKQQDHILAAQGATKNPPYTNTVTYAEARDIAADLCERMHGCDARDIKQQLDNHYKTPANNIHDGTVMPANGGNSRISNTAILGS
jgi:hypothetical protein